MSLDPTLVAANGQPIQYTAGLVAPVAAQPVTATVQATAPTARQAAAAVQDVAGGIVQDFSKDAASNFSPYRTAGFVAATTVGVYALTIYAITYFAYLFQNNPRAHEMLSGAGGWFAPIATALAGLVVGWLGLRQPGTRKV